jgi:hypothetical protein
MKLFRLATLLYLGCTWTHNLFGGCCTEVTPIFHDIYAGPEIYHVERKREGGSKQNGYAYGLRIGFDRLQRDSLLYWGADALYAKGNLQGKSVNDEPLKSHYSDASMEGRFGLTFQQACRIYFSFTPFIGAGYLVESHNFRDPSPKIFHSKIRFAYGCVGFVSQLTWNSSWSLGINFKARFPYDIRYDITHDSNFGNSSMLAKSETQYRLEIPIDYSWCQQWGISLVPFYEYRLYGKQANFPHDFIETKVGLYGATLKFSYEL